LDALRLELIPNCCGLIAERRMEMIEVGVASAEIGHWTSAGAFSTVAPTWTAACHVVVRDDAISRGSVPAG
jgi:hypothetical protein